MDLSRLQDLRPTTIEDSEAEDDDEIPRCLRTFTVAYVDLKGALQAWDGTLVTYTSITTTSLKRKRTTGRTPRKLTYVSTSARRAKNLIEAKVKVFVFAKWESFDYHDIISDLECLLSCFGSRNEVHAIIDKIKRATLKRFHEDLEKAVSSKDILDEEDFAKLALAYPFGNAVVLTTPYAIKLALRHLNIIQEQDMRLYGKPFTGPRNTKTLGGALETSRKERGKLLAAWIAQNAPNVLDIELIDEFGVQKRIKKELNSLVSNLKVVREYSNAMTD